LKKEYKSDKGIIEIESDASSVIQPGDLVFLNQNPAPDGKYKLGLFHSIVASDGKVVK